MSGCVPNGNQMLRILRLLISNINWWLFKKKGIQNLEIRQIQKFGFFSPLSKSLYRSNWTVPLLMYLHFCLWAVRSLTLYYNCRTFVQNTGNKEIRRSRNSGRFGNSPFLFSPFLLYLLGLFTSSLRHIFISCCCLWTSITLAALTE